MPRKRYQREEEEREQLPEGVERFDVPHDPSSEAVVVAACITNRSVRTMVLRRLRPDHFLSPPLAAAVAGLKKLEEQNLDYDPVTMQRLVGDRVDVDFLARLVEHRPDPPAGLEFFIRCIEWDRQRVGAAHGPVSAFLGALKNPAEPPERVRALVKQLAAAFEGSPGAAKYLRDSAELARTQAEDIRQRMNGKAVYPYGIRGLDYFEPGARDESGNDLCGSPRVGRGSAPGLVTVVSMSTGEGKSTTLANMTLGFAKAQRRVLYCAWEPRAGTTLETIACIDLGQSRLRFLQGAEAVAPLTREEQIEHEEKMHELGKHIRFMDNPFRRRVRERYASNDRNLDEVQEHIAAAGVDVVVFDLWERCLLDAFDPGALSAALWRQQAMAEELGFHALVAAQQLTKGEKVRADKRPSVEGIKGSSSYAEVADAIILGYRPGRWKPKVGDNTIELYGSKVRDGREFGVEMKWDGDKGKLSGGRTIPNMQLGVVDSDFGEFGYKRKKREGD